MGRVGVNVGGIGVSVGTNVDVGISVSVGAVVMVGDGASVRIGVKVDSNMAVSVGIGRGVSVSSGICGVEVSRAASVGVVGGAEGLAKAPETVSPLRPSKIINATTKTTPKISTAPAPPAIAKTGSLLLLAGAADCEGGD
jgi:hypothetical protein